MDHTDTPGKIAWGTLHNPATSFLEMSFVYMAIYNCFDNRGNKTVAFPTSKLLQLARSVYK